MARRPKPSKWETKAEKVVIAVLSSAQKDTRLRNPTYKEKGNEENPEGESPLRSIFCLKKIVDMKRIEETEDCFILDFNPSNSIDIAKLPVTNDGDDVDLPVVAESGKRLSAFKASVSAISI